MSAAPHMSTAAAYQAYYDERAGLFRGPVHYWYLMRHFQPTPGASILELGSGTGGNLLVYGKRGHPMVGVEVSASFIAVGRTKTDRLPNVEWVHSFIEDYEPTPHHYDYVLCTEVLEHVFDPVPILVKAAAAVKPSGQVYITTPSEQVGPAGHVRGGSPDDIRAWVEAAGLVVDTCFQEPARHDGTGHLRTTCIARLP